MAISKDKSLFSPFEADETGFNWSKPFMLSMSTEALETEYKRYYQALKDLQAREPKEKTAHTAWRRLTRDYEKLLREISEELQQRS